MNVLAISCHPDDMEIECAGTLLKCAARGDNVTVCHVANGNMGHYSIMPDELRNIRLKEAQDSSKIAGFNVITLDIGDLRVYENSVEQMNSVVKVIREANPDFIITHSPKDYMVDHRAVSKLVFDASFVASVAHYEPQLGPASKVTPLFYMETSGSFQFDPTEFVDITDYIETKIDMLKCHKSQYVWLKEHDNSDVEDKTRITNGFRGHQCGVKYAEAYEQERTGHKVLPMRVLP